jgi:hypothetical protein
VIFGVFLLWHFFIHGSGKSNTTSLSRACENTTSMTDANHFYQHKKIATLDFSAIQIILSFLCLLGKSIHSRTAYKLLTFSHFRWKKVLLLGGNDEFALHMTHWTKRFS